MTVETAIQIVTAIGVVANLLATLYVSNAVLRVKLWTTDEFIKKAEAHSLMQNYISRDRVYRDAQG